MSDISTHNTIHRTVHLSNIIRAQYASGRIALPQDGGLYSRFKHIQGVPASNADGGYPISKLRMIDMMVERLVQMKGQQAVARTDAGGSDADALFSTYARALSETIRAAENVSPSLAAGIAEPGMLFNLVA